MRLAVSVDATEVQRKSDTRVLRRESACSAVGWNLNEQVLVAFGLG